MPQTSLCFSKLASYTQVYHLILASYYQFCFFWLIQLLHFNKSKLLITKIDFELPSFITLLSLQLGSWKTVQVLGPLVKVWSSQQQRCKLCWQLSRRCPVVLGTISKILRESHSDYVLNRIFQQITHFLDIFQPICLIFNIFRGESLSWSWSVGHSVGRSVAHTLADFFSI